MVNKMHNILFKILKSLVLVTPPCRRSLANLVSVNTHNSETSVCHYCQPTLPVLSFLAPLACKKIQRHQVRIQVSSVHGYGSADGSPLFLGAPAMSKLSFWLRYLSRWPECCYSVQPESQIQSVFLPKISFQNVLQSTDTSRGNQPRFPLKNRCSRLFYVPSWFAKYVQ
jgi:hypothetical protein